ncbi:hypothetical protein DRF59_10860 [Chryseobacterium flavum]|uniref:Uncharacterized protein n=1 Tax=Chryseobacterium flavum TaxID=415851 RepID=A0A3D9CM00_9FLAO|nr:hypothetical protein DRF59_10860 [Chryseobacterium flavum]
MMILLILDIRNQQPAKHYQPLKLQDILSFIIFYIQMYWVQKIEPKLSGLRIYLNKNDMLLSDFNKSKLHFYD